MTLIVVIDFFMTKIKKKKKKKILKKEDIKILQKIKNTKTPYKEEISRSQKIKDYIKNTLLILFVATIFTAGWFPFSIIDSMYDSKSEINYKWTEAYNPIIKWCDRYASKSNISPFSSLKIDREPGWDIKKLNLLSTETKSCLKSNNIKIELFNNERWKINTNKNLKLYFDNLTNETLIRSIKTEKKLIKLEKVIIHTNANLYSGYFKTFAEYKENYFYDEDIDLSQFFCLDTLAEFFCDKDNEKWFGKDKMFRLGFLTVEEFWTLSNACSNGCLVDLKYINEDKINYIKEYKIYDFVPKKFNDYSDKKSPETIKFDKMIDEIKDEISKLKKKYTKPDWTLNINL